MRLGVPYQGSKNTIVREIVSILPRGKRFVDLFAGGCAVTHAAILSGKYETFLANDLNGVGVRLFKDAIAGKCDGRWRDWVSREEFLSHKDVDPLISLCWSFSNNGRDYLYGKDIEGKKKELHLACVSSGCSIKQIVKGSGFSAIEGITRVQALERSMPTLNRQGITRFRTRAS